MNKGRGIHPDVLKAIEEIDAAVFSGDTFLDTENREKLAHYLGRWQGELTALKGIREEAEKEQEPTPVYMSREAFLKEFWE